MAGFFTVTDIPSRRVVQYRRTSSDTPGAVYVTDESLLGKAVDEMPFADKTGIALGVAGTTYEVPYLADVGDVYFAVQPVGGEVGVTLKASAKAGTAPYVYQWYKDDQLVVNVPAKGGELVAAVAGKYWCTATDETGSVAVSAAAEVVDAGNTKDGGTEKS